MEKNRIIVMDDLLSDSLMLDYNHMNSDEDYLNYKKSIFYALETKDESKLIPAEYVECKTLNSRFALIYGYGTMEIFCGNKLSITPPNENSFYIKFPYNDIYNKLKNSDYSNDGSVYSKCLSAIVNYIRGQILSPEYFEDMIEHMTGINELILLPMMMYIIKRYIDGLMNVSDNI